MSYRSRPTQERLSRWRVTACNAMAVVTMAVLGPSAIAAAGTSALAVIGASAYGSPFVNENPLPAVADLKPMTSDAGSPGNETGLPAATAPPPVLTLNFVVPKELPSITKFTDVWERMRAGFGIPDVNIKEMAEVTSYFAARPQQVTAILGRSKPYLYYIVDELEKRNMPTELALLPFVESGFNPMALSSAQASGLWQFIPETGLRYNLPQNAGLDARRDVMASTRAALDYLQFLYGMFNDWHLALAAYNWGEKAVAQAIAVNRAKGLKADFASLNLPVETRYYVPRLLAVKQIIINPRNYAVALPDVPNEPHFVAIAKLGLNVQGQPITLSVKDAARWAGVDIDQFTALNAAHNDGMITVGSMPLVVPLERANIFNQQLEAFIAHEMARARAQAKSAPPRLMIR